MAAYSKQQFDRRIRLGCSTAGTAFGQQNIASSNQPKKSQRLNSLHSRQAPTHIEQWISLMKVEFFP